MEVTIIDHGLDKLSGVVSIYESHLGIPTAMEEEGPPILPVFLSHLALGMIVLGEGAGGCLLEVIGAHVDKEAATKSYIEAKGVYFLEFHLTCIYSMKLFIFSFLMVMLMFVKFSFEELFG